MKWILSLILIISLVGCKSKTSFDKPKDLIPKDTLVMLLKDLFIANEAKSYRNLDEKSYVDYIHLVYNKYKIDSTRFSSSNVYYTTQLVLYQEILEEVRSDLDTLIEKTKKQNKKSRKSEKLEELD